MLAIIGGTGLTQLANLNITRRQVVRTPYGDPSGALTFGEIDGHEVVFIARHGYGHTIPPHEINYRANIWALVEQKVRGIISVASVGAIRDNLPPGTVVVPDQIIDYTWGRKHSFFDGTDRPVTHVDFTLPFDQALRAEILLAAGSLGKCTRDGGVYACTQGPRLETAAEIRRIEDDGGDMVGMTGMPEAALAREMGVPYAMLAVVANWAAGKHDSATEIHLDAANDAFAAGMKKVHRILECMSGECRL